MRTRAPIAPKPPPEERNVPIPGSGAPPGKAQCGACSEWVDLAKATMRGDGTPECPSCGAPIKPGETKAAPSETKPAVSETKPTPPETKPAMTETARERAWCSECGAETALDGEGRRWSPCRHPPVYVDDPRKAKKLNPPSPHGTRVSVEIESRVTKEAMDRVAAAQVDRTAPTRIHVPWGKARMPLDRFNAFECGPFDLSIDLLPGEDAQELAKRALDTLERIADDAFERQRKWYEKKLNLLGYTLEK